MDATEKGKGYELNVKIPMPLRGKDLTQAIGYGFHLLLVGEAPREIPEGKCISTRIQMDEKAWSKMEKAQERMPEISKAMLATTALALVKELNSINARL